jgi:hypothetical protein
MTPTPELVARLRRFLGEKIPPGKTETDTRFTDAELEDLLRESETIYGAAALGWTEKAAMIQHEMGEIEETSTGQESYRLVQLKDRLAYALSMAKEYEAKDKEERNQGASTLLLSVKRPEVL